MNNKNILTVEELQEKLNARESVFILDVRPAEQRVEWYIAESKHVDAYKQLNNGDNTVLDAVEIPENATVVTVCAAGRTSLIASEALRKKGVQAYSLEGGMKAWNYAWNSAEVKFDNGLKIIQIRRAAKGCLSYVAGSGNEAIVIDASLAPDIYLQIATRNGWNIRYVTDTHIHADYVSRTRELAIASGAKHILIDKANVGFPFKPVADLHTIAVGNAEIKILHTPGHTHESTSILIGNLAVFTGDTLFTDGVGRPDLKADHNEAIEKSKLLFKSLRKLLQLPPEVMVLPAHTSHSVSFDSKIISSTIGELKKKELLNANEEEFVAYTTSRIPPAPPNYITIASLNKQGSYEGYRPADLEAGGNHCAIK
jgi:glyoxylase-like metal-dependent hydrolase (beta-lactamase superfamily II)